LKVENVPVLLKKWEDFKKFICPLVLPFRITAFFIIDELGTELLKAIE
jgi:hypothetical protein